MRASPHTPPEPQGRPGAMDPRAAPPGSATGPPGRALPATPVGTATGIDRLSFSCPVRLSASQSRVDGLALQRENSKHALMDPPQRLLPHESLKRLKAERELSECKRPLVLEATSS